MPYSRRARSYHVEYVEDRDIEFVRALVEQGSGHVLEVPCGSGRLSRAIAPLARKLTVVDIEPQMVAQAVEAVTVSGYADRVSGEISDMRSLALPQHFDLAVIPREALQLLPPEQGAQALAAVASHLRPGGRLFVDLATFRADAVGEPDPDYYDPSRENGVWRTDWERPLTARGSLTRQSAQYDDSASIRFDLRYETHERGKRVERWGSEMRLYRYDRTWIDDHVPPSTEVEVVYGDYDGSEFSDTSPRLLALYRKVNPAA